ncbi:MAG: RNA-binding protein [Gammaproteobacteria bacterium]|nr:RNA-binding protein [Gammaproteobacteria bacterium]
MPKPVHPPKAASALQRLDKWLWAARFYKTRSQAAEAVSGGHVHVEGQRVKPAKQIRPGVRLTLTRGPYEWELNILALAERRGPASEARTLYEETEQSVARRERQAAERAARRQAEPVMPASRPNKRDRRRLSELKQQP